MIAAAAPLTTQVPWVTTRTSFGVRVFSVSLGSVLLGYPSSSYAPSVAGGKMPVLQVYGTMRTPKQPSYVQMFGPTVLPAGTPRTMSTTRHSVSISLVTRATPIGITFFYTVPGPMVAASSDAFISSYEVALAIFSTPAFAFYIIWPVGRVSDMTLKPALDRGSPFVSIVMPIMLPNSFALTPVATSPLTSVAVPFAIHYY